MSGGLPTTLRLVGTIAIVLTGACGARQEAPAPRADPPAPAPTPAPAPPTPAAATPAPGVDRFVELRKVAGLGAISDEHVVGWKAEFEGGPALAAELSRPYVAVMDARGRIHVADKEAHAIRTVDGDRIRTLAGTGKPDDDGDADRPARGARLNLPNGLHLGPKGLYVLDLGNGKVRRIDLAAPEPTLTTLFTVEGGIDTGRGLWVADDEARVYFADNHRVRRWSREKGVEPVADGFTSVGNLAVDDRGRLWICDRGGDRVFRIETDGTQVAIAGTGTPEWTGAGKPALETGLDGPRSVVLEPDGGYFLALHEGRKLLHVDPAGLVHVVLDGDGNGELAFDTGGFKLPPIRGLTRSARGDLVLTGDDAGFVWLLRAR